MLAFPRPREISAILKHMISCIFISMCLECYLTLSRYHTQINLALEIYYLIMINAKDDVYTVCSLTLANKILIQNCLVTCCAVFEFIQHFSTEKARIKEIHAMNKYYMGWFLTVWYGYFQINWGLFSFPVLANPALTTENNNNNNNMFISHPLYWISQLLTGNLRLPLSDVDLLFFPYSLSPPNFIIYWTVKMIMPL